MSNAPEGEGPTSVTSGRGGQREGMTRTNRRIVRALPLATCGTEPTVSTPSETNISRRVLFFGGIMADAAGIECSLARSKGRSATYLAGSTETWRPQTSGRSDRHFSYRREVSIQDASPWQIGAGQGRR